MRCCFIIFLLLFFACNKKSDPVEVPECKLANITKFGYAIYPLTYDGTKVVKVGNDPSTNSVLIYSSDDKLAVVELPSQNPIYKTELFYNNDGRIAIEKNYDKQGDNWVENMVSFFTYTNGKVTSIREEVPWAVPAQEFNQEVIWDGDNIRSIIIRSGSSVVCSQQYTYDMAQKNFMSRFIDLYYGDNLRPSYKMALYYSANLLIKEENTCPSAQTTNITYDLSDTLHLKLYTNGNEYLSYNYECR